MSEHSPAPTVLLPVRHTRAKSEKRPFSTQLRRDTLARLDWIIQRGYVLTDTVDAAVNTYLDAAGVPRPDNSGEMPPEF